VPSSSGAAMNVAFYSLEMQFKQIWIYNYNRTGQILYKEDQPTRAEVKE
jgi:hypothetical protein